MEKSFRTEEVLSLVISKVPLRLASFQIYSIFTLPYPRYLSEQSMPSEQVSILRITRSTSKSRSDSRSDHRRQDSPLYTAGNAAGFSILSTTGSYPDEFMRDKFDGIHRPPCRTGQKLAMPPQM